MKGTGRIEQSFWDYGTRTTLVQFRIAGNVKDECAALGAKTLDIRAYPESKKRTLGANAYYWLLSGKIAEKAGISTARLHNMHLRQCGYREMMGDKVVLVVIPDDQEESVLEQETFHLAPTSQVKKGKDGILYRTYALLRGSHSFTQEEMSRLIDMTVEEAKECGIETATPEEIAKMKALYRAGH